MRVDIRGTQLEYTEQGEGPVVIWAHPLASSSSAPERVGPFDWSPVARTHRLVRYDARGHGASGGTADKAEYAFESLALDLLALVDLVSPDAPVSGIGMSMGTATLLHAAVLAPGRFDRLVLTAPPTAWQTRAAQTAIYESMADLVEQRGSASLEALLHDAPVPASLRSANGASAMVLPIDVDERLLPAVLRGIGGSNLPARESVALLQLPVLVLPWADDPTHPLSTATELARLLPGSRLEVGDTVDELRSWGAKAAAFLS